MCWRLDEEKCVMLAEPGSGAYIGCCFRIQRIRSRLVQKTDILERDCGCGCEKEGR